MAEIEQAPLIDPLVLRQYIGNPMTGWKVAWSDRMAAKNTKGNDIKRE